MHDPSWQSSPSQSCTQASAHHCAPDTTGPPDTSPCGAQSPNPHVGPNSQPGTLYTDNGDSPPTHGVPISGNYQRPQVQCITATIALCSPSNKCLIWPPHARPLTRSQLQAQTAHMLNCIIMTELMPTPQTNAPQHPKRLATHSWPTRSPLPSSARTTSLAPASTRLQATSSSTNILSKITCPEPAGKLALPMNWGVFSRASVTRRALTLGFSSTSTKYHPQNSPHMVKSSAVVYAEVAKTMMLPHIRHVYRKTLDLVSMQRDKALDSTSTSSGASTSVHVARSGRGTRGLVWWRRILQILMQQLSMTMYQIYSRVATRPIV
jgi:hypothetical protein